jgi:hypothetical protein
MPNDSEASEKSHEEHIDASVQRLIEESRRLRKASDILLEEAEKLKRLGSLPLIPPDRHHH